MYTWQILRLVTGNRDVRITKRQWAIHLDSWFVVLRRLEEERMAKRKPKMTTEQKVGGNPAYMGEWLGFADIRLTPEERQEFLAHEWEELETEQIVAGLLTAGHKITVSYNRDNDHFNVSITGVALTCVNGGLTLSGFAPEWPLALRVVLYKSHYIAQDDWRSVKDRPSDSIG